MAVVKRTTFLISGSDLNDIVWEADEDYHSFIPANLQNLTTFYSLTHMPVVAWSICYDYPCEGGLSPDVCVYCADGYVKNGKVYISGDFEYVFDVLTDISCRLKIEGGREILVEQYHYPDLSVEDVNRLYEEFR